MKEILRTNDAVLLSWASAMLADAGIEAMVFDIHTSILEGSISAIPRRLMVADDDHAAALRLLDAAGKAPAAEPGTTRDALLGGRVTFDQPAQGYRAAIDPVMLAAALPPGFRGRIADLGCGAGAASLCAAARLPGTAVLGIERDPFLAGLARQNVAHNGLADRIEVVTADIRALPPDADGSFDAVIANPPYLEASRANPLADARKGAATVEDEVVLELWLETAIRLLRHKGMLVLIHRADRLGDVLTGLQGQAGEVVVFPLWPKAGRPAKRVIVRARKGLRSPLVVASGLVLHEEGGAYTAAAEAVLRDAQGLEL